MTGLNMLESHIFEGDRGSCAGATTSEPENTLASLPVTRLLLVFAAC